MNGKSTAEQDDRFQAASALHTSDCSLVLVMSNVTALLTLQTLPELVLHKT